MKRALLALSLLAFPAQATTSNECIALAIYWEARGEPISGQRAVAHVIRNRTRHPAFPSDPCAVISQRGQFRFTRTRRITDHTSWERARQIAVNPGPDLTNGATFFHAIHVRPAWGNLRATARIGNHVFYASAR